MADVTNSIIEIEQKYNLLEQQIAGVYFWKIIRFDLTNAILKKLGWYDTDTKLYKKSKDLLKILKNDYRTIRFNALKNDFNCDVLVFQSPRKTVYNGEKVDIYTHFISEELNNNGIDLKILDFDSTNYYNNKSNSIASLPLIWRYLASKFIAVKLSQSDMKLLKNIQNELRDRCDVEFELKPLIKKWIKRHIILYRYYYKLFSNIRAKKILIVCSYGLEPLIDAAKRHNIEVIEVQHGTISSDHMGFSFPNVQNVPYFPDKLIIFGEYWMDTTSLPLKKSDIIVYGYPYYSNRKKKYECILQKKNYVVFISQWTIGQRLSEIALKFAKENPEFNVVYKLHPKEYYSWRELYPKLNQALKFKNFEIVDNSTKELYEILGEAEYVVGVYSTVLYEGLALGRKTILVNLPGIQSMRFLIDKGMVCVASNEAEIKKCIINYNFINNNGNYFIMSPPNNDVLRSLF